MDEFAIWYLATWATVFVAMLGGGLVVGLIELAK